MSCSPLMPKKAQVVEVKVGDTLMLGCTALDIENEPVDLTDVTITAQARKLPVEPDEEEVTFDFEVDMVNALLGTYEMWYPGGGQFDGIVGEYQVDVQYEGPYGSRTIVRSSRDFFIRVLPGVTP